MKLTTVMAACVLAAFSGGAFAQHDAKYLKRLAEANIAEIEAGKLAAQRAASPEVKKFAQQMVDEHGRQLQEIRKLAQAKNIELPSKPDEKHRRVLERLASLAGEDFDRRYLRVQVHDHRDAAKLAERTAKRAEDAGLKAAAQKAAPEIQGHLKTAEDLAGKPRSGKNAAAGASGAAR